MTPQTVVSEPVPMAVDGDGSIRIGGTRITLDDLIAHFDAGATPEEIGLSCNECGQVAARSSGRRGVPTAPATSELTGRGAPA